MDDSEFEDDVNFIFTVIDAYLYEHYDPINREKHDSNEISNERIIARTPFIDRTGVGLGPFRDNKVNLRNRNEQDRYELINEQKFVRKLCMFRQNDGPSFDIEARKQTLRAAKIKVKASIERFEIEAQQRSKTVPVFFIYLLCFLLLLFWYFVHPDNFLDKLTSKFSLLQPFILGITIIIAGVSFSMESHSRDELKMHKRRLELIEQAIELIENYKSKIS